MPKVKKKRKSILVYIGIAIIVLIFGLLLLTHVIKFTNNKPKVTTLPAVIHTLTTPSNPNATKGPTSSNGVTQGTSSSGSGSSTGSSSGSSTVTTTPENQWTTSQSGLITLKDPIANATISSGVTVDGSASVTTVQYVLIDNQVGQISQGSIPVVNGNFSATIKFTPYATSGRLDVFSNGPELQEENLIEIPVNFK